MTEHAPPTSDSSRELSSSFAARLRELYVGENASRIQQTLDRYLRMLPAQVKDAYHQDKAIAYSYHEIPEGVPVYDPVEAFVMLPEVNSQLAHAVYAEFAESSDWSEREEIVMYLANLCRVNREAGLQLWDHLVRDPHPDVRRAAYDELEQRISPPTLDPAEQAGIDESLAEIGLMWRDVAYLSRAFVEADHHPTRQGLSRLYQPGTGISRSNHPAEA